MEFALTFGAKCKIVHRYDYVEMNIEHYIEQTAHQLIEVFYEELLSVKNLNRANVFEGLKTYFSTQNWIFWIWLFMINLFLVRFSLPVSPIILFKIFLC